MDEVYVREYVRWYSRDAVTEICTVGSGSESSPEGLGWPVPSTGSELHRGHDRPGELELLRTHSLQRVLGASVPYRGQRSCASLGLELEAGDAQLRT